MTVKNTNPHSRKIGTTVQVILCLSIWMCASASRLSRAAEPVGEKKGDYHLFARINLAVWRIVPFDAKARGPEERAAMLEKLGFKLFAYDEGRPAGPRPSSRSWHNHS